MIRFVVHILMFLASAAIGLLVASWLLDDFVLHPAGFVTAVVIYVIVQAIMTPFVTKMAARYASALLGGTGLVAAFLALLVATLVSDGLEISGAGTWVAGTVIVWLVTALATVLLPLVLVKLGVEAARERRADSAA